MPTRISPHCPTLPFSVIIFKKAPSSHHSRTSHYILLRKNEKNIIPNVSVDLSQSFVLLFVFIGSIELRSPQFMD